MKNLLTRYSASHQKDILILIFVCLLTMIVRIPFMSWPLLSDEGGYAYTAYWWFKGFTLYSDQLWFDRPQGIFLAYKLGMVLFGSQTWAIRLWGALWAAGTGIFVYLIAKRLSNQKTAFVASMIYAIFSAMPQIEGFTSNAEVFALLPATASLYCLIIGNFSMAGILVSLAFLLKPSGGSIIIFGLIWIIYNRFGWYNLFKYLFCIMPLIIIASVHGAHTVGFVPYLHAVATYRLGVNPNSSINIYINLFKTSIIWLPLCILSLFTWRNAENKIKILFLVWLLSSFVGIAIGKNWYWHYFIQMVPPIAFGSAFGLLAIFRKKRLFFTFIALLILSLPIAASFPYFLSSPIQGSWLLYHRPGYTIANEVSNYLYNNTNSYDEIYVSFAEAEIYFLSERRSSIPYLYRLDLLNIPGVYNSLIQSIKNQSPTYIVALDPPLTAIDPENRFQEALDENYFIETYIQGTLIYKRRVLTATE